MELNTALQEARREFFYGTVNQNNRVLEETILAAEPRPEMTSKSSQTNGVLEVKNDDIVTEKTGTNSNTTFSRLPHKQPVDIQFNNITYTVNLGFRKGTLVFYNCFS